MYSKRIKILIALILLTTAIMLTRLVQMQLLNASQFQDEITKLKLQRSKTKKFKTIRGQILDRNNTPLAENDPKFQLNITYELSSALDQRVIDAKIAALEQDEDTTDEEINETKRQLLEAKKSTQALIEKCSQFGHSKELIYQRMQEINNDVWTIRKFLAWLRNNPDKQLIQQYGSKAKVPLSIAMQDFEKTTPPHKRQVLINNVDDILEMKKTYNLLELSTSDQIFSAQLEFMNIDKGIEIIPLSQRIYRYNSTASQTIGWIGPENDSDLFAEDKLLAYKPGDLSGRRPGIEYLCEPILRGRRGKELYDIDKQLIRKTQSQIGSDVTLTIDIELQKRIEDYITKDPQNIQNANSPTAAVVIDTNTGEILAMVSTPTYNLNTIRKDYGKLLNNPKRPLINRTINALYPAGSVTKPLIAIIALELEKITPDTVISCPHHDPPAGWPRCWIQRQYKYIGHDDYWQNNTRNALKGSCNIFFSRLADKIESRTLQKWLYDFSYGHHLLTPPAEIKDTPFERNLIESDGIISSSIPKETINNFDQIPNLNNKEKRFFGIGQGNLRVTPLQVAASMSIIANKGIYRPPTILKNEQAAPTFMDIKSSSFDPIWEGMHAVVSETNGTAYKEFGPVNFHQKDVKIYGKTGSTQGPTHAWFAGFANDSQKRSIAFAVIVEGGQHGSSDAGPIAREIINYCIDADYIGNTHPPQENTE